MRRVLAILLGTILLLSACNRELTITEVEPEKIKQQVLEAIQPASSENVQMLYNPKRGRYIVVHASGPVTMSVEDQGTVVGVFIQDHPDDENEILRRYVFKLDYNRDYDSIQLYRNNLEIPFDNSSSY
ncbi:hypothetical protein [Sporosarcina sp. Te-1]|uniref:hypothetical protein n=1 Tax=Sporosarcina sp. Te-1 TaxID=2818390 RepID=UPI001A9EA7A6|nr:hypothetical protein [Sporosarcina sp. Te-1]QTD39657.1 hypothetical protein J3U78_12445 [Sporosarcina sp. Te-1]